MADKKYLTMYLVAAFATFLIYQTTLVVLASGRL